MSWINFKKLKEDLSFRQVLDHYQVEFKVKGERASCFCPLPTHSGKRRSPSFSADLRRGLFQCFGCGAKGNVLDFACLMEKLDPQDSRDFYKVSAELEERFFGVTGRAKTGQGGALQNRPVFGGLVYLTVPLGSNYSRVDDGWPRGNGTHV